MEEISLIGLEDEFVIHYGGELAQVNAYTFGNSLLAMSSILDEINSNLNPGYKIEITVLTLRPGSFRPVLKVIPKSLKNLFSLNEVKSFTVSVLASLFVNHVYSGPETTITYKEDTVIIVSGDHKVILPIAVYEASEELKDNQKIQGKIKETFETLEQDPVITDFGIARDPDAEDFIVKAKREEFPRLSQVIEILEGDSNRRVKREKAELIIIKPVLENSSNKWRFVWREMKISATMSDEKFMARVVTGQVSFTYGDRLSVLLLIHQEKDHNLQEFLNVGYEVEEVFLHTPSNRESPPPLF